MAKRKSNRKQHTVPRVYLSNFTDTNGSLWMLNTSMKVYKNAPQNTLTKDYFYDVNFQGETSLFVEKGFLDTLEGIFARIYKDKISQKLLLTEEEKGLVSIFVAAQLNRVPARRNAMVDFINRIEEKTKPFMNLSQKELRQMSSFSPPTTDGDSMPVSELLKYRENIDSNSSVMLPALSVDIAEYIFNMQWGFMYYEKGDNFFITSDDPCTMVNPEMERMFGPDALISRPGLEQNDVELMIPLSPTIALLCGWKLKQDLQYIPVRNIDVNNVNQRQLRHGSLIITNSEKFANHIKHYIEHRKKLYVVRNVLSTPLMDIIPPLIQEGDLN